MASNNLLSSRLIFIKGYESVRACGKLSGVVKKKRTPNKGDRVTITLHQGTFVVYSVDRTLRSVDLAQIGSELRLASIPWRSIKFLKHEAD